MEENLIEGEFKNEFANVDESLEAENININERVVKKIKFILVVMRVIMFQKMSLAMLMKTQKGKI